MSVALHGGRPARKSHTRAHDPAHDISHSSANGGGRDTHSVEREVPLEDMGTHTNTNTDAHAHTHTHAQEKRPSGGELSSGGKDPGPHFRARCENS